MRIPKLLLFALLLFASIFTMGQNATPYAELDGVRLKKVVSDTSIATGQTFSYSLYISIPAGLTSVQVFDNLPSGLVFHSISAILPSLGTPVVTLPAVGSGGTVNLSWPTTTTALNGMITVTVSFPNGVTCNGDSVYNRLDAIWRKNDRDYKLNTTSVKTRAIANNPWHVAKGVLGLPNLGGACPFRTDTNVVRYRIRIYKDAGSTGQLNLVNGVITDVLPAGATLVAGPTCVTQSGTTLTWNVGNMSALPNLNAIDCDFSISYPLGTTGSITNTATLTGTLGSTAHPCGTFTTSSSVCVTFVPPTPGGIFSKTVSTTGQPGCGGRYVLRVTNTGTDPATVSIRDTLPSELSIVTAFSSPAGALIVNHVGNIVTATSATPIAPGQTVYVVIDFTILSGTLLNTSITNCAYDTLTSTAGVITGKPCATFMTNVPGARACIWKQVCNKQPSYTIGNIIRYRLRVQNTGGIPLTGGSITDVLSPNLAYVGNPSYHTSTNWNVACGAVNPWGGVTVSTSGSTVTFNLPTIQPTCQDIFYGNCGAYGSPLVPFYFIEFDVKVVDTAAIGNTPNAFTFLSTGLNIASNTDFVNIIAPLGIGANKDVSADGGSTWSNSVVSSAGATVQYRLKSNIDPGSVGLRHMSFVDLLPRNNNSTSDHFTLTPCAIRGSDFDLTVVAPLSTSPFATGFNNAGTYAKVNGFNPTPFPGVLFSGCGTSGDPWNTTISGGDRNIGYYFGYSGIGSSSPASAIFSAKVSPEAEANTKACNSFALIGFIKYLLNTSSVPSTTFISGLPVESEVACVEVQQAVEACIKKLDYKVECKGKSPAGHQQYDINISGDNINPSGNTIILSSPAGSFSPNSFSIPFGGFSVNSVFTDIPPTVVGGSIMVYLSLYKDNVFLCRDSIRVKLPKCPEEEDCCTGFIHEFYEEFVKYDVEKDQVYLGGCINAGPEKIQNFSYTIVSAEREVFCEKQRPYTERIYGDILYSGLNLSMYPGFSQWLDYITREVKWGKYKECYNLMEEKLCYRSILAFPPPPQPCEACYDVLKFSVRYSFTDCRCLTCDTVIHYQVTRRCRSERSEFVKGNAPIAAPSFLVDRKVVVAPKSGGTMRTPNK